MSLPTAPNQRRQGCYWLFTVPRTAWEPCLPEGFAYIRGQAETGEETSYEHWQVFGITSRKTSITGVKSLLGVPEAHCELTRSRAADEYVWKEVVFINLGYSN